MLAAWHNRLAGTEHLEEGLFNPDFHSLSYYGANPVLQEHYAWARSYRQPSILVFLAQDEQSQTFSCFNANLRKGQEAQAIFAFIAFWKRTHGQQPRHLVFDFKLTTYANLACLDEMSIDFITLRHRRPKLLTGGLRAAASRVARRRAGCSHPPVTDQRVAVKG